MPMASRAILSNFFEGQWTQNYQQYFSGLSRALFPTTFLEIAVYGYIFYGLTRMLMSKNVNMTSRWIRLYDIECGQWKINHLLNVLLTLHILKL